MSSGFFAALRYNLDGTSKLQDEIMRPILAAVLFVGGLVALVVGARWWTEPEAVSASVVPPGSAEHHLVVANWDARETFVVDSPWQTGNAAYPIAAVNEELLRRLAAMPIVERYKFDRLFSDAMFRDSETGELFRPTGAWAWPASEGIQFDLANDPLVIDVFRE